MFIKSRFILLVLYFLYLSIPGNAQFRSYSNEFLNIGAGARGIGMGSAQVASAEDGNAGYWNPAGLTNVYNAPSVSLMTANYFAGIGSYQYASVAVPSSNGLSTLGFSFLRFAVDDIPNTLFLVEPDGSLNYNNIQSFSSSDYAFLFSYAQIIKDDEEGTMSWGANTKIIHRNVGSFARAWGFGFDGGFLYRKSKWRFGLAARDITTTFNAWSFSFTDAEKEVLYLTNNDVPVKSTELTAPRLVPSFGYNFKLGEKFHLLAEADLDMTFDGKRNTLISASPVSIDPKLGLEANINNVVFIRGGVSNFQQGLADGDTINQKKVWLFQPSIGAGFKTGNMSIDYAFSNLANQSNPLYSHIISLKIDLAPKGIVKKQGRGEAPKLPPSSEKTKKKKGNYPIN